MSRPHPVNWFEIPTKDLNRAKKFYETVFNTELTFNEIGPLKMEWFPLVEDMETTPGTTGSLIYLEECKPSHDGTVVYFAVEDIEATLAKINSAGGKTLKPKQSIGEYGFIAHFEDSEGNLVALHSKPE